MSHLDHLKATRTHHELAKLVVDLARDNAGLRNEVHRLEHEIFWHLVRIRQEAESPEKLPNIEISHTGPG